MMKNSKFRRILLLLACAVLLVSLSVSATLAYLTSTTVSVENTFTVGSVGITLDELDVDEYGKKKLVQKTDENDQPVVDDDGEPVMVESTARDTANAYKLIPGHTYIKDPTVHVDGTSENGWLFVKVVNGIAAIEADGNTIAKQMEDKGWKPLGAAYPNIYYYNGIVKADDDIVVFEQFKIDAAKSGTDLEAYKTAAITVQAYMVQADNFDSAADAYADAPCNEWK